MAEINLSVSLDNKGSGSATGKTYTTILNYSPYVDILANAKVAVTYDSDNDYYIVGLTFYMHKIKYYSFNNIINYYVKYKSYTRGSSSNLTSSQLAPSISMNSSKVGDISDTGETVAYWSCYRIDNKPDKITSKITGINITWGLYKTSTSTSSIVDIPIKINVTITKNAAPSYTVTLNKGAGTQWSDGSTSQTKTETKYYGQSFSLSNYKPTPPKSTKSDEKIRYTITYDYLPSTETYTNYVYKDKVYYLSKWEDKSKKAYATNASYKVTGNDTLTASYSYSNKLPSGATWTLGVLTTKRPVRMGYEFDGNWYYKNGSQAQSSDTTTSDVKLYPGWNPKSYQIKLDANGGPKLTINSPVIKTYGSSVNFETWDVNRFGYKFDGWTDSKDGDTIVASNGGVQKSSSLDAIYDKINKSNPSGNTGITLYAKWSPIPNKYKFEYYVKSGNSYISKTIEREYNITNESFRQDGISSNEFGDKDYAFLGWSTVKRVEFTSSQGGIIIDEDRPNAISPITLTKEDIAKVEVWDGKDPRYNKTFYGYWTISGKNVWLNGEWTTCMGCWVYTKEEGERYPSWKWVDNVATYVNNKWQSEIGRKL